MRSVLHVFIPLSFALPILILIFNFDFDPVVIGQQFAEWLVVLLQSNLQAFLSAFFSVLFGFLISLGLLSLGSGLILQAFRFICLIPAVIPPVVVGSFLMFRLDSLGFDLQGLSAIVLAHVIMNAGICAIVLESFVRQRLSGQVMSAKILGASDIEVVSRIMIPQLMRPAFSASLLVFGLCLVSFVVPLMLSPSEHWSLEVYIYQFLKVNYDFQMATLSSLGQAILLLSVVFLVYPKSDLAKAQSFDLPILNFSGCLIISGVLFFAVFLSTLLELSPTGGGLAEMEPMFWTEWFEGLVFSISITWSSLILSTCLLLSVLFTFPRERLHRFLLAFIVLSPVVLAFSLWMLGGNDGWMGLVKISFGITWFYFPAIYRWKVGGHLEGLRGQAQVARSLGASDWLVFKRVVLPQSREVVVFCMMLMSLWASGDYVMTSILSFSSSSLPMLVETLTTSYRMGLAVLTSSSILLLGGGFAFCIWMIDRALGGKRSSV